MGLFPCLGLGLGHWRCRQLKKAATTSAGNSHADMNVARNHATRHATMTTPAGIRQLAGVQVKKHKSGKLKFSKTSTRKVLRHDQTGLQSAPKSEGAHGATSGTGCGKMRVTRTSARKQQQCLLEALQATSSQDLLATALADTAVVPTVVAGLGRGGSVSADRQARTATTTAITAQTGKLRSTTTLVQKQQQCLLEASQATSSQDLLATALGDTAVVPTVVAGLGRGGTVSADRQASTAATGEQPGRAGAKHGQGTKTKFSESSTLFLSGLKPTGKLSIRPAGVAKHKCGKYKQTRKMKISKSSTPNAQRHCERPTVGTGRATAEASCSTAHALTEVGGTGRMQVSVCSDVQQAEAELEQCLEQREQQSAAKEGQEAKSHIGALYFWDTGFWFGPLVDPQEP